MFASFVHFWTLVFALRFPPREIGRSGAPFPSAWAKGYSWAQRMFPLVRDAFGRGRLPLCPGWSVLMDRRFQYVIGSDVLKRRDRHAGLERYPATERKRRQHNSRTIENIRTLTSFPCFSLLRRSKVGKQVSQFSGHVYCLTEGGIEMSGMSTSQLRIFSENIVHYVLHKSEILFKVEVAKWHLSVLTLCRSFSTLFFDKDRYFRAFATWHRMERIDGEERQ